MVKRGKKKRNKAKRRMPMSIEERARRAFSRSINLIFDKSGFTLLKTEGHQFTFMNHEGEIDFIFLFRNLVVIVEDTTESNVGDHLRKKHDRLERIEDNKREFLKFLSDEFPTFESLRDTTFTHQELMLRHVYCSKSMIGKQKREDYSKFKYLEYSDVKYFERLVKTIQLSAKFELLKFLGLRYCDVYPEAHTDAPRIYEAIVLPEPPSGFPEGFKIFSFLIDPETLIMFSFVLRKDSWIDTDALYQRMIIPEKIKAMRKYLKGVRRTYINNVVASIPDEISVFDLDDNPIDLDEIVTRRVVRLQLPMDFDSIGIIDGQHRVLSYHEGVDPSESYIRLLRKKQHLLVSGIVFPASMEPPERRLFESKLFLEINDTQKKVRPIIRDIIKAQLDPWTQTGKARQLVSMLSQHAPLEGLLESHFFDHSKIRVSSIIRHGLPPLLKTSGNDSIYALWEDPRKHELALRKDTSLLTTYLEFASTEYRKILSAYIRRIPVEFRTHDKKISKAITPLTIIGIIFLLRTLIEKGKTGSYEYYYEKLKNLSFDWSPANFPHKASNWNSFGSDIYTQCFEEPDECGSSPEG